MFSHGFEFLQICIVFSSFMHKKVHKDPSRQLYWDIFDKIFILIFLWCGNQKYLQPYIFTLLAQPQEMVRRRHGQYFWAEGDLVEP